MNVVDCLGGGASQARALDAAGAEIAGTVLLLQLGAPPSDPYEEWVTAGALAVVERLRALQGLGEQVAERNPVTVLCAGRGGAAAPAAEALFEATRGIVQSVTLEPAARALRCNVLRAEDAGDERVLTALRYLASDDGGFAVGSTLDLVGSAR
jgi:hypothetical protein